MSALGHKQTFGPRKVMSALPPKADIAEHNWHVRFVPKADILPRSKERRAIRAAPDRVWQRAYTLGHLA